MVYVGIGRNSVTCNIIINGYGKAKLFGLMENCLIDLIESKTAFPEGFTLNSVIWFYGNCENLEKKWSLY